jgi:hypothetical protein
MKKYFKDDVIYYENFVSEDICKNMIEYFESKSDFWGDVAFYQSYGMGIAEVDPELPKFGLDETFFLDLKERFKQAVIEAHGRDVKANTSHAQKWETGAYANDHSDNSDFDGNPNAFEINKYVGILYLNRNYDGGNLNFRDHNLSIAPESGMFITFPGGIENVHSVTEITEGTRYTMVSFWDYAEAEYSEERRAEWEEEFKRVRAEQAIQREGWNSKNGV